MLAKSVDLISIPTSQIPTRVVELFAASALPKIERGEKYVAAICGGRTIKLFLEGLQARSKSLPASFWKLTHWVVTDDFPSTPERPKTNSEELSENFFATAIEKGLIPHSNYVPFPKTVDDLGQLKKAAEDYSQKVLAINGNIDAVVLGSGGDVYWPTADRSSPIDNGHVAAIFPGRKWTKNDPAYVAFDDAPKPPLKRVTISPRCIKSAQFIVGIISGVAKANALANFLSPNVGPDQCPIKLLTEVDGDTNDQKRYLITDIQISAA
jgi:6-phosphogluconolactonase